MSGTSCREQMFSMSEIEVAVSTIAVNVQSMSSYTTVTNSPKTHITPNETGGLLLDSGKIL